MPFEVHQSIFIRSATHIREVISVCVVLPTVDDPYHRVIEALPRCDFSGFDRRALKLDHQSAGSPDVRHMPLVGFLVHEHDFLPVGGKAIFPLAMPLGFRLPPGIAMCDGFMRPMPNQLSSALRNNLPTAFGASSAS